MQIRQKKTIKKDSRCKPIITASDASNTLNVYRGRSVPLNYPQSLSSFTSSSTKSSSLPPLIKSLSTVDHEMSIICKKITGE